MPLPLEDLWSVICRIPSGKAASYGEVGKALRYPASGYMVGRWMGNCPSNVPWWRVVAKDGHLPLGKRSVELANEQETRLREEGVSIEDGLVAKAALVYASDLLAED